ncbi:hypothetical protein [Vibrio celticus]|uniref:Uncharacterized protein n=1 Tax=Vibrio celticus TaxID=446372 RepID=A0A1C3JK23_9VIBR|nr:hypothetical protein [Vibrio celticus]SBT15543.1 hypothetical protein VCE7224_04342 [Vibrio celticus]
MMVPSNGTNNTSVVVEGLKVKLAPGFYTLDTDFVKPGLVLEKIMFSKELL